MKQGKPKYLKVFYQSSKVVYCYLVKNQLILFNVSAKPKKNNNWEIDGAFSLPAKINLKGLPSWGNFKSFDDKNSFRLFSSIFKSLKSSVPIFSLKQSSSMGRNILNHASMASAQGKRDLAQTED